MKIDDFIKNIAEELNDEASKNIITQTTPYKQLDNWSSMVALLVIARIHEDYEVLLNEEDLRQTSTIMELYQLVKQQKS